MTSYRCKNSNKQHDKRHRDIGFLVREIQQIDNSSDDAGVDTPKTLPDDIHNDMALHKTDDGDQDSDTKSEPTEIPMWFGDVRNEFESGLAPARSVSPSPSLSRAKEIRLRKRAARTAKSTRKVTRRKPRRSSLTIAATFIEHINIAIHGQRRVLATVDQDKASDALREDIYSFLRLKQQLDSLRKKDHRGARNRLVAGLLRSKRETQAKRASSTLEAEQIQIILINLGIKLTTDKGEKGRKNLLAKLGSAIKDDIEIVANEAKETMKRQAGYWRYVNKRTYNAMVRNSKLVNWETGERLRELELDDGSSEEESIAQVHDDIFSVTTKPVGNTGESLEGDAASGDHREVERAAETDLVLRRSPGSLIFSLTPAPQLVTTVDVVHLQETNDSELREVIHPAQNGILIEPIITHRKRDLQKKQKRAILGRKGFKATHPEALRKEGRETENMVSISRENKENIVQSTHGSAKNAAGFGYRPWRAPQNWLQPLHRQDLAFHQGRGVFATEPQAEKPNPPMPEQVKLNKKQPRAAMWHVPVGEGTVKKSESEQDSIILLGISTASRGQSEAEEFRIKQATFVKDYLQNSLSFKTSSHQTPLNEGKAQDRVPCVELLQRRMRRQMITPHSRRMQEMMFARWEKRWQQGGEDRLNSQRLRGRSVSTTASQPPALDSTDTKKDDETQAQKDLYHKSNSSDVESNTKQPKEPEMEQPSATNSSHRQHPGCVVV
jgi:hypothetical protein